MRKLLAGECSSENIFDLVDPTQYLESDFEAEVVKALGCLLPEYLCGVFAGAFVLEGERRVSDLALIHKSLSHWFVIEVELAGHSLEHHVLPQVRCFRYGEAEVSCVTSLTRGFPMLSRSDAEGLLRYVPRHVAVVGNIYDPSWEAALAVIDTQYATVCVYKGRGGRTAHEVHGSISARSESLGFAQYSATDNCLRIAKACGLSSGTVQFIDQFGNLGDWSVQEKSGVLWIQKATGPALIAHESYVQIVRGYDGRLALRLAHPR